MIAKTRPLAGSTVAVLLLLSCSSDRAAAPGSTAATSRVPVAQPAAPSPAPVSPPGIRLPDTFRPSAQRVTLEVTPSAERFSGRTEIEGTLGAPTDVVWLNADAMEIDGASARVGTEELKAEPVVRQRPAGRAALRPAAPRRTGDAAPRLPGNASSPTRTRASSASRAAASGTSSPSSRRPTPAGPSPASTSPRRRSPGRSASDDPQWDEGGGQHPGGERDRGRRGDDAGALPDHPTRSRRTWWPSASVPSTSSTPVPPGSGRCRCGSSCRGAGRRRQPTPRAISPQILEVLEDYFGIAYPYEKLDILTIPVTVQFGAMENAGLVTFRESLVLARPEEDGVRRQRRYAMVAAHELAHQWFGDLVTTGLVGRHLAQRGLRHLDGDQGASSAGRPPGGWPPSGSTRTEHRRQRRRPGERAAHPPAHRELRRHPQRLRRHHLRQGRGGHPDVRALGRRGHLPARRSPLPGGARRRKRHLGGLPALDLRRRRPGRRPRLRHLPRPARHPPRPCHAPLRDERAAPVVHLEQDRWLTSGPKGPPPGSYRSAFAGRRRASDAPSARSSTARRRTCRSMPAPARSGCCPTPGTAATSGSSWKVDLRDRLLRARALDDAEVVGLLGDTEALGKGGALPRATGLALATRYARAPGAPRHRRGGQAGRGPAGVPPRDGSTGDYRAWVRRTFGFRALGAGLRREARRGRRGEADPPRAGELRRPPRGGAEADRRGPGHRRSLAGPLRADTRCQGRAGLGGIDPETLFGVMEVAGRAGDARFHDRLRERLAEHHRPQGAGVAPRWPGQHPRPPRCWTTTSSWRPRASSTPRRCSASSPASGSGGMTRRWTGHRRGCS